MTDRPEYNDLVKIIPTWGPTLMAGKAATEWVARHIPEGWAPTVVAQVGQVLRVASRRYPPFPKTAPPMIYLYLSPMGWAVADYWGGAVPLGPYDGVLWSDTPQEAYAVWTLQEATQCSTNSTSMT